MSKAGYTGAPKVGGGDFAKFFRLQQPKDGPTTFECRIVYIPEKGGDDGAWSKYFGVHFGFKGRDKRDNTKTRTRTFKCVLDRDFRTKIVRHACAQCTRRQQIEDKLEMVKAQAIAAKKSPEQIETITKAMDLWLKDFNVDSKHYINVMTPKGELGTLLISHRLKKQLDVLLDELMHPKPESGKKPIDPFDPDAGLYFIFKRMSNKGDADTVTVAKTTRTVGDETFDVNKMAPMSDDQWDQAQKLLPKLTEVVTIIGDEQIERLVALGASPDPDEVDAIFDGSQVRVHATAPEKSRVQVQTTKAEAPKPEAEAPKPASKAEAPEDDDAEVRAAMAVLAAAEAKKKAKAAPVKTEVTKPEAKVLTSAQEEAAAPAEDMSDLSDDAFLDYFGAGHAGDTPPGEATDEPVSP